MARNQPTVLLIDDSPEDRELYRRYLAADERYTYQIFESESGEDGLALCQKVRPDVILLDYLLPDLNGLDVLEQLQAISGKNRPSVVMLTSQENEQVAAAVLKSGACEYLVKGKLTAVTLIHTVHSLLEQRRLHHLLEVSQKRQQLMATAALRIRQFLNCQEVLNATVQEVRQFLECDRVLVYQFAPDMSGTIVAESVAAGWTTSLGRQIQDTCFQTHGAANYCQGRKRAIPNIYEAGLTNCHINLLEQFQVKANLVVPILLTDSTQPSPHLWGLLIAHQCSSTRQWEAAALEFLNELAMHIAISIQQAQLFEQLQQELGERKQTAALQQSHEQLKQVAEALGKSDRKFRAIFNNTFQFTALLQPDGTLLEANQTALDFGGLTTADVLGKPFWQAHWWGNSTATQEQLKAAIKKACQGEFVRYEIEMLGKEEQTALIDFSLKSLTDDKGQVILLIAEGRDISEVYDELRLRKQAEEKLQAANAELARSNQELEQFAYMASHDLREPLRKIKSYIELFAETYQGQLDATADKYINYITDAAVRMEAFIADLLNYSRVGRGELVVEPTPLGGVVEQILEDLSQTIEENNAQIVIQPLPTLAVNPGQMAQLFQNLITNALKFRSEATPQIQIEAKLHKGEWLISVSDNGIGIKPQYSERIFEIFQRLHSRAKYPGTGIGLAICKKIVERHGGQIGVKSEFAVGTTFWFTLPMGNVG